MKLFSRRAKARIPTEEDVANRKKTEAEIEAEVQKGNFEKANELATKCVQDYRGKDPFGEAYCRYLISHCLMCKHLENMHQRLEEASLTDYELPKMRLADYNRAKKNLERSLKIYELFARNKRYERNLKLESATVLFDMSLLESFVEKWNKASDACQRSFEIYEKYEDKKGMQNATRLAFSIRTKKVGSEVFQLARTTVHSDKKD